MREASRRAGTRMGRSVAALAFWLLFLTLTMYLHEQWQRYEPTRVMIDAAAAIAALPFALIGYLALA